mgnify:CR=1 FL=1
MTSLPPLVEPSDDLSIDEVKRYFPERIFSEVVPRSVRLAEAPSYGQSIIEYDRASRGAAAYEVVAGELMQRVGQRLQALRVRRVANFELITDAR